MANVIGQALIEVVAGGGNFEKTIAAETRGGFAAAEASAAESGGKIGTNMKGKFSSAFGGIGQVAKLALGAGLIEVFHAGLDKEKEYEKGLASLEAGLKSTHGVSNTTAEGMEHLAESVQHYSGQTSDSIVQTEQLLLTFTNIRNEAGKGNDVFNQTTKIAADMAARMGGDASGQAIRLGKALNDPIKGVSALARVGVQFDAGQKASIASMVKAGNTMGAQKVILGELSKEFGGSAEAAGKTLPGQLAIAKETFEDLAQHIIQVFLPVMHDLIGIFQAAVPMISALAPVLGPLALGILAVVVATKAWNVAQELFNHIMKDGSLTTGGWITILILLVTAVIEAYQHSKTFRDIVQAAFRDIEAAARVLEDGFKSLLSGAVAVFHGITDTISGVFNWVHDHWPLLLAILGGPFGLVVLVIVNHFNDIKSTVTGAYNFVVGIFGRIVNFVTGMPGKIAGAASGMWDGIKDAFREAIDWIIRGWNSLHFKIPGFGVGPIHFGGFDLGLPQIPELATGGRFGPGMFLAGEFGPELVASGRNGTVFSRSETQHQLGGVTFQNGALQIIVQGHADAAVLDKAGNELLDRLALMLRGRGVQTA